jgi:hypothetical protein
MGVSLLQLQTRHGRLARDIEVILIRDRILDGNLTSALNGINKN